MSEVCSVSMKPLLEDLFILAVMKKEEVHALLTAYQLLVDKFMSHTDTHTPSEHTAGLTSACSHMPHLLS